MSVETEVIAQACWEANRAYCTALNDFGFAPWDEIGDDARRVVVGQVAYIQSQPNLHPHDVHEKLVEHLIEDGWTYSRAKDVREKTDPYVAVCAELPSNLQARDKIFVAIVTALS
jgi:hypothetical protein